jgi:CrcB protein
VKKLGNALLPVICVGVGGFIGALMRYLTSLVMAGYSITIPYGTLISNGLGCFVIGIVAALTTDTEVLSPNLRLFIATGICGGFTTMSSFVYELAQYIRSDQQLMAAAYLGITLVASILMFYAGAAMIAVART